MKNLTGTQIIQYSEPEIIQSIENLELRFILAYGTLRQGGSNYNSYLPGIRATGRKGYLTEAELYTHGPYPFLIQRNFQSSKVIIEEIEILDPRIGIEISEMEFKAGYAPGTIDKYLVYFWPSSANSLSGFLNQSVNHIPSGDWFNYKSTSPF